MERERVIQILDYFTRYTDEEKGVTLKEIQTYLANQTNLGTISTASIRRDIDSLIFAGYQIETERGAHNTYTYRLVRRGFTFNEIRFLADSVSINKFLSVNQKQRLFQKFEGMCSRAEVRKLMRHMTLDNAAPPGLDLLDNLDLLYQCIAVRRKVLFRYGKYNMRREMVYDENQRNLIPCRIIYRGERFYLKCIVEETGQVRIYRVDRMERIRMGGKVSSIPALPEQQGAVVDIYEPERYEMVHLRVRRVLLDDMLEQLGSYASVIADASPEYVVIRAKVGISFGFYRWVMKFGSAVEILSPSSVRGEFVGKLGELCALYEDELGKQ